MRKPQSVRSLEDLGRVRLSDSFFMRDFLYSEIGNFLGMPNIPNDPDLAVAAGTKLCEQLLEPLQQTFGRIAIRSAYRSRSINDEGNKRKIGCCSSDSNRAAHIWDERDANGNMGAMACIVIPWFINRHPPEHWRSLAYWIHNHLDYSSLCFFPELCAFNIGWRENPERRIHSYIEPVGKLLDGETVNPAYAHAYEDFPVLTSDKP